MLQAAYPGLLQPLPVPNNIWTSISMDFIESLPKSQGKNVIFMVVDRLSKYAYFIPLAHPFTAQQVAQAFLDNVYKLHGLPESTVSDRDKIFLSKFWSELFKLLQVQLLKSTSYHPQTDGQTKTTPFESIYGIPLPVHVPYLGGLSKVEVVDKSLKAREVQVTVRMEKQHKFSPKYYGPFKIITKVGQVAYQLELNSHAQIHNVLHVSQLKGYKGSIPAGQVIDIPLCDQNDVVSVQPLPILDRKTVKKRNVVAVYRLIQWTNGNVDDATWEPLDKLNKDYLAFDLNS
ncbi:retrotransposable element Tf2 [Tanacetum coccineum]